MARVGRRAVLANRRARAIGAVEPVVAVGAQAAELAELERGVVPSMRRDVVGDGRWRDAASFQAKPTQRLDRKLMRSAALPASGAIPAMDLRTVRHRGISARAQSGEINRVWLPYAEANQPVDHGPQGYTECQEY